jgi:predicted ATP-dependent protease
VTKKIEGFYDVCRIRGLTGDQGVIIPEQNIKNLMLREDVIEAVREGKFHVYPVRTIDEGVGVLTGREAGDRQDDGTYPEDSVNFLVDERLKDLATKLKAFGKKDSEEQKDKES